MLSQHNALRLQTNCIMAVPAPMVEAARTPKCMPYGPRLYKLPP